MAATDDIDTDVDIDPTRTSRRTGQ